VNSEYFDIVLGPRPTEVWKRPCARCPSMSKNRDPESQDMLDWYAKGEATFEYVTFRCAWRPTKLCHGVVKNCIEAKAAYEKREPK